MQKIGASTGSANALGEFTEGNPGAGVAATLLKAAWLNAIQRELVHLVEGAGLTLDAADDFQILKAIQAIQISANTWLKLSGKPTTVAGFGITDVFTKTETTSAIQTRIADLVASSPETLNTLKELAEALGNDPNFATTMTNALARKADKATTLGGYGIRDAYTHSEADSLLSGKAAKATTLAGYGITNGLATGTGGIGATAATSELANAFAVPHGGLWSVTPGTQGVPFSYGSLLHAVYDGNQSWTQIAADMAGSAMYWRGSINGSVQQFKKLWDESNFNPLSRITAINCPQAGFTDGTPKTPFMTHANGVTVKLARTDAGLGYDRTYVDVTASRAANVIYTNDTGAPIQVLISFFTNYGGEIASIYVGGVLVYSGDLGVDAQTAPLTFIVPNGSVYSITLNVTRIQRWVELR